MAQASTVESKDRAPNIWALITLSSIPFIMVLGNSMLIPVLPTVSKVLNVSYFQVQPVDYFIFHPCSHRH